MTTMPDQTRLESIVDQVLNAQKSGEQLPRFTQSPDGLTLFDAYKTRPILRERLEDRGEKINGRKIGFTNYDMLKAFGVTEPIWGYCTDQSVFDLDQIETFDISGLMEPKIEPEIVFGVGKAPEPGMDEAALLDCMEWASLGFEIVHSVYPGWQFDVPDVVAANSLHGAVLIGDRQAITQGSGDWLKDLQTFDAELWCNDGRMQTGGAMFIMGSPLTAIRHFVEMLAKDRDTPPVSAGEILSTGTLTPPLAISPGETWDAKLRGLPLENSQIRIQGAP